jgi:FkbM family methyltransferase
MSSINIEKIRRRARFLGRLVWFLGPVRASDFLLCYAFGIKKLISVQINGFRVNIRTATKDLVVAFSSFADREYEGIKLDDVRFVIDAGANIGTSAIWFATKHPQATVIAIEPESENFDLMKLNVAGYPAIKPIKAALAGAIGRRELFDRGTGPWGYTIASSSQNVKSLEQSVECITVESILATYTQDIVDILKLDIEGGEKEVLEDSKCWICSMRVIVVELHDRIVPGCFKAFENATQGFARFSRLGEKHLVYRDPAANSHSKPVN